MKKYLKTNYRRILKFLVAGGSAALVEYAVFILLHSSELNLLLANTLSFLCGLVVSYSLNRLWVFRARDTKVSSQFSKYFTLAMINLALSDILIWVFIHELSLQAMIAKVVVMAMVAMWNYLIFSKLIFVEKQT